MRQLNSVGYDAASGTASIASSSKIRRGIAKEGRAVPSPRCVFLSRTDEKEH